MPHVDRRQDEHGQVVVFFALLVPMLLMVTAVVVAGGNWYTHAKNLQTKVDAAALAGGDDWAFPCGPDSDSNAQGTGIVDVARQYFGSHMTAAGTGYTSPLNPQVGGVPGSDMHVVINGNAFWDDDAGSNPADQTTPSGSVCESKILDVKATEGNSFPLASVLPLFPDIKRKARLQIEEAAGVTGLLPIAVRIPRPLSAVAVFYNEQDGNIISSQYMREVCIPTVTYCVPFAPAGLGQWTTDPASATAPVPGVSVATTTGVVIASSFRAACNVTGATAPCLDASPAGVTDINAFCNQNRTVTCWDATGSAGSSNVEAGVQFIRGYGNTPTGTGTPQLRSAYLRPSGAGCEPYLNSLPTACSQILNLEVDLGALESLYPDPPGPPPGPLTRLPLRAQDVQVRYRLVRSNGTSFCDNYGTSCDLIPSSPTATGTVTFSTTGAPLPIPVDSWENSVAIEIRLRDVEPPNGLPAACSNSNFNANCRWYYTATSISPSVAPTDAEILASPIQRSFMGSVDRTGPLRWLRLDIDPQCNNMPFESGGDRLFGWVDPPPTPTDDAASRPVGSSPCYVVNIGLQGGMARDQDEPPVALLLGSGSSQRALVHCDDNVPFGQVEDEIRLGCQYPAYTGNKFADPPGPSGWCPYGDDTPGTFFTLPKPSFPNWDVAFDCVLTRPTASANQMMQGFNQRLFGVNNNPACPADDGSSFQAGRNYWHRANNSNQTYGFAWDGTPAQPPYAARGAKFSDQDKRVVSLFLTPYGSFTSAGTQVQELVGLGSFYITGYGRINGGRLTIEDPCSDGASSPVYQWAGNDPPPDLDLSRNTTVLWGHFIKDVPGGAFGGTHNPCQPELSFNPCVPVLVE